MDDIQIIISYKRFEQMKIITEAFLILSKELNEFNDFISRNAGEISSHELMSRVDELIKLADRYKEKIRKGGEK